MKLRTIAGFCVVLSLTMVLTSCQTVQKSENSEPVIKTWTKTIDEKEVRYKTIDGVMVHESVQITEYTKPVIKTWTKTVDDKKIKYMSIDGVMVHETDTAKQPLPPIVTPGTSSCGDKAGTGGKIQEYI